MKKNKTVDTDSKKDLRLKIFSYTLPFVLVSVFLLLLLVPQSLVLIFMETVKIVHSIPGLDKLSTYQVYTLVGILSPLIYVVLSYGLFVLLWKLVNTVGEYIVVSKKTSYDSVNDILYFRDILPELSPGMVSFLLNLQLDYDKVIVGVLLKLNIKQYIEFQSDGIKIMNTNYADLTKDEADVINLLTQNKELTKANLRFWESNIVTEAKSKGYIVDNDFRYLFQRLIKRLGYLIFLLFPFLGYLVFAEFVHSFITGGRKVRYQRTELGNELTEKLVSLKRFISEFTLLGSVEKERILLWQDFLIYAVLLEENKVVVKEIAQHFKVDLHDTIVS